MDDCLLDKKITKTIILLSNYIIKLTEFIKLIRVNDHNIRILDFFFKKYLHHLDIFEPPI